MEDAQLRDLNAALLRLGDGDRSAADTVFSLLWPPLVAFASARLGDEGRDAAQSALTKVFEQASAYDPDRSALAWALAITSWECKTIVRKRVRRREATLDPGMDVVSETNVEEEVAQRTALEQAIASLSPKEQAILTKAFFEERNSAQTPAFRKQKERALRHLRALWRNVYVR